MTIYFTWPNIIILLSVLLYFVYNHVEEKLIKDEREELIRLKTYAFAQKANTFALTMLSGAYFFLHEINGILILFILILSSLYTEMAAKFYFRRKY